MNQPPIIVNTIIDIVSAGIELLFSADTEGGDIDITGPLTAAHIELQFFREDEDSKHMLASIGYLRQAEAKLANKI